MAIEIREITIKTQVNSGLVLQEEIINEKELESIRFKILEECKRLILSKTTSKRNKR